VIKFDPAEVPSRSITGRVFLDGPMAGQRDRMDLAPDAIAAPGGVYVRSVACVDDGLIRYLWRASGRSLAKRPSWPWFALVGLVLAALIAFGALIVVGFGLSMSFFGS
jgi:hypothetical protein